MNYKQQQAISEIINLKTKYCPTDGKCYNCQKNIFDALIIKEDMPVVTSCPYCNASFVE